MNAESSIQVTEETPKAHEAPQTGLIGRAYRGLEPFTDRLERIEAALEDLRDAGDATLDPSLRKMRRQIREFEPSVTMIGQVKAGKTSLVNAMVGWPDLLPADINPWTSVVTSLHIGPSTSNSARKARFSFFSEDEWSHLVNRGGRMGELAERAGADRELEKVRRQLEDMREKSRQRLGKKFEMLLGQTHEYGYVDAELIERYVCLGDDFAHDTVADKTQGRFADITRAADLFLGNSELPMRLCVRDTPGVNDTFMIREQITVNAIRESRLCVVVLSAHQALSTVDMALIRLISNIRSREVVIFVNRIDELAEPAREIPEIRESIRATLKEHGGPQDAEIIFGSAHWAGLALRGDLQNLGKASAEALLNWAEDQLDEGDKRDVSDMVWRLSGLPELCATISGRIAEGEGGEFADRLVRTARNLASGITAAQEEAKRRLSGAPTRTVSPAEVDARFADLAQRCEASLEARFASVIETLDARLSSSRRTFLSRATASLVKHLEKNGEDEIWNYDPSGLRMLLRTGYQVFAARAAKAGDAALQEAAAEVAKLYTELFQPKDDSYSVEPPSAPRAPDPVMLGQTIALDIQGNWWSRWWRRRRSYEAYAEEFSALIDAEIAPMVEAVRTDCAEPYRETIRSHLREFLDAQVKSLRDIAAQTEIGIDQLRDSFTEGAEARAEKLASALSTLGVEQPQSDQQGGQSL